MKKPLPTSRRFSVSKTLKNSHGFTLIELLVVITIIAVLSIIGLVIYTGVQKGARDAKRRQDIEAISKVLEAHYNDTSSPCNATAAMPYCASANPDFFAGNALPSNPEPAGAAYTIIIPPERTSYSACALLENANGNSSSSGDGITFTAASGASATYYCVKNQQ